MELRSGTLKENILINIDKSTLDMSGEVFKLHFVEALKDEQCAKISADIISNANKKLSDDIKSLKQSVDNLKKQVDNKEAKIKSLELKNAELEVRIDDLEQYSRRASMRIYGLAEETPGSTDDKVLHLVNHHLKLQPPLEAEEIEVSHRVGTTDNPSAEPRATLVKFLSRRSKTCVMDSARPLRTSRSAAQRRPQLQSKPQLQLQIEAMMATMWLGVRLGRTMRQMEQMHPYPIRSILGMI